MPALNDGRYKQEMIAAEREVLKRALVETGGDLERAARNLNIAKRTYYLRLDYCGLDLDLMRLEIEANEGQG